MTDTDETQTQVPPRLPDHYSLGGPATATPSSTPSTDDAEPEQSDTEPTPAPADSTSSAASPSEREPDNDRPTKVGALRRTAAFFTASREDYSEIKGTKKQRKGAKKATQRGGEVATTPNPATRPARSTKEQRKRIPTGIRYGGGRRHYLWLNVAVVVLALFSVLALLVAVGRPTDADVKAAVAEALEEAGHEFPSGQVIAWTSPAVRDWATWDEADPDNREQRMTQYLSRGMDPQAGWNRRGTQGVLDVVVDPEPRVISDDRAIVSARYLTNAGAWRCVQVPVFAYQPAEFSDTASWAVAMTSNPTPVGCNPRTGAPTLDEDNSDLVGDAAVSRDLATNFFPGFFSAWAASDQNSLTQYTAAGVQTMGLGGAMASVPAPTISATEVLVDREGGAQEGVEYPALVSVTWTIAGTSSQTTATYNVPVVQQGDRWYVAGEPTPAPQGSEVGSGAPAAVPQPGEGQSADGVYESPEPTTDSSAAAEVEPSTETAPAEPAPTETTGDDADSGAGQ